MEYDLQEYGHVGVFGATGSGKTTYIKHILKQLDIPKERIYIYTTTGYQWDDVGEVFDDFGNIGELVSKINKNKHVGKSVLIFDDFNEVINTQTNPKYIGLFTHGRHAGIIVINGAHAPTSMGSKARKQLKYTAIMNTSDMEILSSLSQYYLLGDTDKLIKSMDNKPDKFTAVVIENETRKLHWDKANSKTTGNIKNNIGNKEYTDCNVMDQSNNNYTVNQNIEIKNMIEANTIKNELSIVNYKHKLEIKKLESQEELKNLILKFGKTRHDYNKMVSLLNTFITNRPITHVNFTSYIQPFMTHYYPEAGYKLPENNIITSTVEENIADLYSGDYQSIAISQGLKYGTRFLNSLNF